MRSDATAEIERLTRERDKAREIARDEVGLDYSDMDKLARSAATIDYCAGATDEIERLTRERDEAIASSDAVCNSYAAENQRLFDRAETAEAALARASAAMEAMAQSWSDRSEKLAPTGKRTNHVDRHVAAVLRGKADELRALVRDTGGDRAD